MSKKLVFLLLSGFILAACGGQSEEINLPWKEPTLSKNPILLTKQDLHCVGVFDANDEVEFYINQFVSGDQSNKLIRFKNQVVNNYVMARGAAAPISETHYGLLQQQLIDVYVNERRGYEVRKRAKVLVRSSLLTVCPDSHRYESQTFEGAGLNISYAISKTYQQVRPFLDKVTLAPIKVHVAPLIRLRRRAMDGPNQWEQSDSYLTDNASYSPKTKMITFLPQSKEYAEKHSSAAPFWEIPMVASHEYGHHVFQSLVKDNISKDEMFYSPGCFESGVANQKHKFTLSTSRAFKKRDNGAKFALGALNEGFADLIAYYALDKDERALTNIDCFEDNREVGSNEFRDGTEKLFSLTGLWELNSSSTSSKTHTCNSLDFQEIHHVGAVFAHNADKLISKVIKNKKIKLKVILNWAQGLAKIHERYKKEKAGDYLFRAIELVYLKALKEAQLSEDELHNRCKDLRDVFTGKFRDSTSCDFLQGEFE